MHEALERLRQAESKSVGAAQTARALARGRAALVFVARDAERRVTDPVIRVAQELGVEVVEVDSMRELGRTCGIAVGAAVAAITAPAPEGRPL